MGWMPAPMELSIASSLWVVQKNRQDPNYRKNHSIDFNTGYITTIILALMFMALGASVQYGQSLAPLSGENLFINLLKCMQLVLANGHAGLSP